LPGFFTDIESETAPIGLNEDTVRFISAKKGEPEWLLEWRLAAFRAWLTMTPPDWAKLKIEPIDYQASTYYSAPKAKPGLVAGRGRSGAAEDLREARHSAERAGNAGRRAQRRGRRVFDSVSVATTFKGKLAEAWASSSARWARRSKSIPELVRQYLGSVVPTTDNFFAALNSRGLQRRLVRLYPEGRALPDGAVDLFPHQRAKHRPVRAHADRRRRGRLCQLSRRLHGAAARREPAACGRGRAGRAGRTPRSNTRPSRTGIPATPNGKGGIYNFVTKRGDCRGANSKISWTQVETGSAITWKYPSCILKATIRSASSIRSRSQQPPAGRYRHQDDPYRQATRSRRSSPRASRPGTGQNTYRGLVKMLPKADGARNYTQCDSLLIGDSAARTPCPISKVRNRTARVEHEATTSKISEDQMFYCRQRGLSQEDAVSLIVNGFCREVLKELPMEFAVEAQKLLASASKAASAETVCPRGAETEERHARDQESARRASAARRSSRASR
jgi:Fe-S cluster assembly protein SufB